MKPRIQIERKENKTSARNNEAKVSRTFDGAQKALPMFMTWIKGVLMYKGITQIMKVAFKNVLLKI